MSSWPKYEIQLVFLKIDELPSFRRCITDTSSLQCPLVTGEAFQTLSHYSTALRSFALCRYVQFALTMLRHVIQLFVLYAD
jgi:hypothetical protein